MSDEEQLNGTCLTGDQAETIVSLSFWIEGILAILIAAMGLIANTITAIILSKKDMRHTFNSLLIGLVAIDAGFLIFKISDSVYLGLDFQTTAHTALMPQFLYPLEAIFLTASVYMVVAISIERYRTLCYPTTGMTDCKKVSLYIGSVIVLSFAINMPKFFEGTIQEFDGEPYLTMTELRMDPHYKLIYVTWFQILTTFILPMVVLIFCNLRIYKQVARETRFRRQFENDDVFDSEQQQRFQETKLAIVLMSIAVTLFLCHFPRGIVNIYEGIFYFQQECIGLTFGIYIVIYVSHLLLNINSSINIVFYVALNPRFREHFLSFFMICGLRCHQEAYERQELVSARQLTSSQEPFIQEDERIATDTGRYSNVDL